MIKITVGQMKPKVPEDILKQAIALDPVREHPEARALLEMNEEEYEAYMAKLEQES